MIIRYICKKYYMKPLLLSSAIFVLLFAFSSCVSKKDMIYFQSDSIIENELLKNYAPKIQTDDVLSIYVSALDPESTLAYNLFAGGQSTSSQPLSYLVDVNGAISFPELGTITVVGMTTNELKGYLTSKLERFIKKPIVTIRLENFRITILGEVRSPGSFSVPSERISVSEAIGMAGDLTIQGKRKNVLLIRNNNGKFEKIRLDLTNESLFKSPYYYLAQNDVLYIEPNRAKVNSSALGTTSSLISVATAILSLVFIFTR